MTPNKKITKFQVWRCYNGNEDFISEYDDYNIAVAALIKSTTRGFARFTIKTAYYNQSK